MLPCKLIYKTQKYLLLMTLLTFYGGPVCSSSFCKLLGIVCCPLSKKKCVFFLSSHSFHAQPSRQEKSWRALFIRQPSYVFTQTKVMSWACSWVILQCVLFFTGLHTVTIPCPVIFTNVKKILNTKNGIRKNGNFGLLMAEQMSQKAQ